MSGGPSPLQGRRPLLGDGWGQGGSPGRWGRSWEVTAVERLGDWFSRDMVNARGAHVGAHGHLVRAHWCQALLQTLGHLSERTYLSMGVEMEGDCN